MAKELHPAYRYVRVDADIQFRQLVRYTLPGSPSVDKQYGNKFRPFHDLHLKFKEEARCIGEYCEEQCKLQVNSIVHTGWGLSEWQHDQAQESSDDGVNPRFIENSSLGMALKYLTKSRGRRPSGSIDWQEMKAIVVDGGETPVLEHPPRQGSKVSMSGHKRQDVGRQRRSATLSRLSTESGSSDAQVHLNFQSPQSRSRSSSMRLTSSDVPNVKPFQTLVAGQSPQKPTEHRSGSCVDESPDRGPAYVCRLCEEVFSSRFCHHKHLIEFHKVKTVSPAVLPFEADVTCSMEEESDVEMTDSSRIGAQSDDKGLANTQPESGKGKKSKKKTSGQGKVVGRSPSREKIAPAVGKVTRKSSEVVSACKGKGNKLKLSAKLCDKKLKKKHNVNPSRKIETIEGTKTKKTAKSKNKERQDEAEEGVSQSNEMLNLSIVGISSVTSTTSRNLDALSPFIPGKIAMPNVQPVQGLPTWFQKKRKKPNKPQMKNRVGNSSTSKGEKDKTPCVRIETTVQKQATVPCPVPKKKKTPEPATIVEVEQRQIKRQVITARQRRLIMMKSQVSEAAGDVVGRGSCLTGPAVLSSNAHPAGEGREVPETVITVTVASGRSSRDKLNLQSSVSGHNEDSNNTTPAEEIMPVTVERVCTSVSMTTEKSNSELHLVKRTALRFEGEPDVYNMCSADSGENSTDQTQSTAKLRQLRIGTESREASNSHENYQHVNQHDNATLRLETNIKDKESNPLPEPEFTSVLRKKGRPRKSSSVQGVKRQRSSSLKSELYHDEFNRLKQQVELVRTGKRRKLEQQKEAATPKNCSRKRVTKTSHVIEGRTELGKDQPLCALSEDIQLAIAPPGIAYTDSNVSNHSISSEESSTSSSLSSSFGSLSSTSGSLSPASGSLSSASTSASSTPESVNMIQKLKSIGLYKRRPVVLLHKVNDADVHTSVQTQDTTAASRFEQRDSAVLEKSTNSGTRCKVVPDSALNCNDNTLEKRTNDELLHNNTENHGGSLSDTEVEEIVVDSDVNSSMAVSSTEAADVSDVGQTTLLYDELRTSTAIDFQENIIDRSCSSSIDSSCVGEKRGARPIKGQTDDDATLCGVEKSGARPIKGQTDDDATLCGVEKQGARPIKGQTDDDASLCGVEKSGVTPHTCDVTADTRPESIGCRKEKDTRLKDSHVLTSPGVDSISGGNKELPVVGVVLNGDEQHSDGLLDHESRHARQEMDSASGDEVEGGFSCTESFVDNNTSSGSMCDVDNNTSSGPMCDVDNNTSSGSICDVDNNTSSGLMCDVDNNTSSESMCDVDNNTSSGQMCDVDNNTSSEPMCDVDNNTSSGPMCDVDNNTSSGPMCDVDNNTSSGPMCDVDNNTSSGPICDGDNNTTLVRHTDTVGILSDTDESRLNLSVTSHEGAVTSGSRSESDNRSLTDKGDTENMADSISVHSEEVESRETEKYLEDELSLPKEKIQSPLTVLSDPHEDKIEEALLDLVCFWPLSSSAKISGNNGEPTSFQELLKYLRETGSSPEPALLSPSRKEMSDTDSNLAPERSVSHCQQDLSDVCDRDRDVAVNGNIEVEFSFDDSSCCSKESSSSSAKTSYHGNQEGNLTVQAMYPGSGDRQFQFNGFLESDTARDGTPTAEGDNDDLGSVVMEIAAGADMGGSDLVQSRSDTMYQSGTTSLHDVSTSIKDSDVPSDKLKNKRPINRNKFHYQSDSLRNSKDLDSKSMNNHGNLEQQSKQFSKVRQPDVSKSHKEFGSAVLQHSKSHQQTLPAMETNAALLENEVTSSNQHSDLTEHSVPSNTASPRIEEIPMDPSPPLCSSSRQKSVDNLKKNNSNVLFCNFCSKRYVFVASYKKHVKLCEAEREQKSEEARLVSENDQLKTVQYGPAYFTGAFDRVKERAVSSVDWTGDAGIHQAGVKVEHRSQKNSIDCSGDHTKDRTMSDVDVNRKFSMLPIRAVEANTQISKKTVNSESNVFVKKYVTTARVQINESEGVVGTKPDEMIYDDPAKVTHEFTLQNIGSSTANSSLSTLDDYEFSSSLDNNSELDSPIKNKSQAGVPAIGPKGSAGLQQNLSASGESTKLGSLTCTLCKGKFKPQKMMKHRLTCKVPVRTTSLTLNKNIIKGPGQSSVLNALKDKLMKTSSTSKQPSWEVRIPQKSTASLDLVSPPQLTVAKPHGTPQQLTVAKPHGTPQQLTVAKPHGTPQQLTVAKLHGTPPQLTVAKPHGTPQQLTVAKPHGTPPQLTVAKPHGTPQQLTFAKLHGTPQQLTVAKLHGTPPQLTVAKPHGTPPQLTVAKPHGTPPQLTVAKPHGTPPQLTVAKPHGTPQQLTVAKLHGTPQQLTVAKLHGTQQLTDAKLHGTPQQLTVAKQHGTPQQFSVAKLHETPQQLTVAKLHGTPQQLTVAKLHGTQQLTVAKQHGTPQQLTVAKLHGTPQQLTVAKLHGTPSVVLPRLILQKEILVDGTRLVQKGHFWQICSAAVDDRKTGPALESGVSSAVNINTPATSQTSDNILTNRGCDQHQDSKQSQQKLIANTSGEYSSTFRKKSVELTKSRPGPKSKTQVTLNINKVTPVTDFERALMTAKKTERVKSKKQKTEKRTGLMRQDSSGSSEGTDSVNRKLLLASTHLKTSNPLPVTSTSRLAMKILKERAEEDRAFQIKQNPLVSSVAQVPVFGESFIKPSSTVGEKQSVDKRATAIPTFVCSFPTLSKSNPLFSDRQSARTSDTPDYEKLMRELSEVVPKEMTTTSRSSIGMSSKTLLLKDILSPSTNVVQQHSHGKPNWQSTPNNNRRDTSVDLDTPSGIQRLKTPDVHWQRSDPLVRSPTPICDSRPLTVRSPDLTPIRKVTTPIGKVKSSGGDVSVSNVSASGCSRKANTCHLLENGRQDGNTSARKADQKTKQQKVISTSDKGLTLGSIDLANHSSNKTAWWSLLHTGMDQSNDLFPCKEPIVEDERTEEKELFHTKSVNKEVNTACLGLSSKHQGQASRDHSPASRNHSPASRNHSPASRNHSPASIFHSLASRSHSPASRSDSPASRSHSPASRDHSPASRSHSPASRESREHSPASRFHSPASRDHCTVSESEGILANGSRHDEDDEEQDRIENRSYDEEEERIENRSDDEEEEMELEMQSDKDEEKDDLRNRLGDTTSATADDDDDDDDDDVVSLFASDDSLFGDDDNEFDLPESTGPKEKTTAGQSDTGANSRTTDQSETGSNSRTADHKNDEASDSDMEIDSNTSLQCIEIQVDTEPCTVQKILRDMIPPGFCFDHLSRDENCIKRDCRYKHDVPSRELMVRQGLKMLNTNIKRDRLDRAYTTFCEISKDLPDLDARPLYQASLGSWNIPVAFGILTTTFECVKSVTADDVNWFIFCCGHNAKKYIQQLWDVFLSFRNFNIHPAADALVRLLRTFVDGKGWGCLWHIMCYCIELDNFIVPYPIQQQALMAMIQEPDKYISISTHWLQNSSIHSLQNIDKEVLTDVCKVLKQSNESEMAGSIAKFSIQDRNCSLRTLLTSQIAKDGWQEPDHSLLFLMDKQSKLGWLNRIQGIIYSKNLAYLGEIFVKLGCPIHSDIVDKIIEVMSMDKNQPDIVAASFVEFLKHVVTEYEAATSENEMAVKDDQALAHIANSLILLVLENSLQAAQQIRLGVQSLGIDHVRMRCPQHADIFIPTLNMSLQLNLFEDAMDIVKGTSVTSLTASQQKDWFNLQHSLYDVLFNLHHLVQCGQILTKLLDCCTMNRSTTQQMDLGVTDMYEKLTFECLHVGDIALAAELFTCYNGYSRSMCKERLIWRGLLSALVCAGYYTEAQPVYEASKKHGIYPVQNVKDQILNIPLWISPDELVIIVREELMAYYHYLCSIRLEGKALSHKHLSFRVILIEQVPCPPLRFPFLSEALQTPFQAPSLIDGVLTTRLECCLETRCNSNESVTLVPESFEKYLWFLDKNGRKQGLQFKKGGPSQERGSSTGSSNNSGRGRGRGRGRGGQYSANRGNGRGRANSYSH